MQYSRLAFTRLNDRPIAIAGLEKRLIIDLKTHGGFGVFDDGESLLRRSLLWRRGAVDVPTLRKIAFPPERNTAVPTWSWMAYEGGIDFLELPLGGVEWQEDEVHSPWIPDTSEVYHTMTPTRSCELSAIARDFDIKGASIIYDTPGPDIEKLPLKCIVMGRQQQQEELENARHYALFITPIKGASKYYERIGVGFLQGKYIELEAPGLSGLVKVR